MKHHKVFTKECEGLVDPFVVLLYGCQQHPEAAEWLKLVTEIADGDRSRLMWKALVVAFRDEFVKTVRPKHLTTMQELLDGNIIMDPNTVVTEYAARFKEP